MSDNPFLANAGGCECAWCRRDPNEPREPRWTDTDTTPNCTRGDE